MVILASQLQKVPDVINRRQLLLSAASGLLLPRAAIAAIAAREKMSWSEFQAQMVQLADTEVSGAFMPPPG